MFIKSFIGACIAGAALSMNLKSIDQTPAALAQIEAAIDASICLRTAERNKAALPDFYGILGGSAKWTDPVFKADWTSMAWKDAEETFTSITQEFTTWKRASEAFPGKTLFGTEGIRP